MISVKQFLVEVENIVAEEPGYQKGHDGSDSLCDCIGLIIGAIRRAGGEWDGLHGSNYAARHEMKDLQPIYGNGGLEPGEVVFKAYEPGQKNYKLPGRYKSSRDKRDYYHIGVVVSVYPLRIRHMSNPKPKTDTSIGKWAYHGHLSKVNMEEEELKPMGKVIVAGGDTNYPIKMRKAASEGSDVLTKIPQGSEAELLEGGGVWNRLLWNGKEGYVQSRFITAPGAAEEMISVQKARIEKIYDELGDMLGYRG